MSPEEKRLLEETVNLSRENRELLGKLVGHMRWARFWTFLRWAVVFASVLGIYYYLQPALEEFWNIYEQVLPGQQHLDDFSRNLGGQLFGEFAPGSGAASTSAE